MQDVEIHATDSILLTNETLNTKFELPNTGSGIIVKSNDVVGGTAQIYSYLTLVDKTTGEVEYRNPHYIWEFGLSDWSGIKLEIPASTHQKGNYPIIQVYRFPFVGTAELVVPESGSVYVEFIRVNTGGLINIESGTGGNFDGVLVVM
jgi:hypothetical protein